MANKTITDLGATMAEYVIRRRGSDADATITIQTSDGDVETVSLSKDELISATTAQERTNMVSALASLYAAALTKGGFA